MGAGRAPEHPLEPRPLAVEEDRGYATACWIWQSWVGKVGYGGIGVDGKQWLAHRWSYTKLVGSIPDGMQLDHLCGNRLCVNPDHLEPKSAEDHIRRHQDDGHLDSGRHQREKRECPHGHAYDDKNTAIYKGKRNCRICIRERAGRRRARAAHAH